MPIEKELFNLCIVQYLLSILNVHCAMLNMHLKYIQMNLISITISILPHAHTKFAFTSLNYYKVHVIDWIEMKNGKLKTIIERLNVYNIYILLTNHRPLLYKSISIPSKKKVAAEVTLKPTVLVNFDGLSQFWWVGHFRTKYDSNLGRLKRLKTAKVG